MVDSVTLEEMRDAFARQDYMRQLALSLQPARFRTEHEQAEVLYYRAYICCVFKRRNAVFQGIGRNLIERVVTQMKSLRHPMLVSALINATAHSAFTHGLIVAKDYAGAAFVLALEQQHPRLYDATFTAQNVAVRSGDVALAGRTSSVLERYLVQGAGPYLAPTYGLYSAVRQQCRAAILLGDRKQARRYAQLTDELLPCIIQPAQEVATHDCTVASWAVNQQAIFVSELLKFGLADPFVQRLRSLQRSVTALPHLCQGAEVCLWVSLATVAVHLGAPAAPQFWRAAVAVSIRTRIANSWSVNTLATLNEELRHFQPQRLKGEVADLLEPAAWPFPRSLKATEQERATATAPPAGLNLLH